jgi:hypothetical protein
VRLRFLSLIGGGLKMMNKAQLEEMRDEEMDTIGEFGDDDL